MSWFSAKRGCNARSNSPLRPRACTAGVPAIGAGSSAPLRTTRKRPEISVTRILPSGRNAMLHGWTSPFVTVRRRPRSTPVSKVTGESGRAGDGQLMPLGALFGLALAFAAGCCAGAVRAVSATAAAAAAAKKADQRRVCITDQVITPKSPGRSRVLRSRVPARIVAIFDPAVRSSRGRHTAGVSEQRAVLARITRQSGIFSPESCSTYPVASACAFRPPLYLEAEEFECSRRWRTWTHQETAS
jgi:hypothetical protein